MNNVVGLKEYRLARAYDNFYSTCNINLALDNVPRSYVKERNIRKEMISGYMKLLSKQH